MLHEALSPSAKAGDILPDKDETPSMNHMGTKTSGVTGKVTPEND